MKLNKKTLAVTTAALTIVGGGAAYAFFGGGSGHGTAVVAPAPAFAVNLGANFASPAFGTTVPVTYVASNPGADPATLHGVVTDPDLAVVTLPGQICPAGSFLLSPATWLGLPPDITVPGLAVNQTIGTADLEFHDLGPNIDQTGCGGATLNIDYRLN